MQLARLLTASIPLLACLTQISAIPVAHPQATKVDGTALPSAPSEVPGGDQAPTIETTPSSGPGRQLTQCTALQNDIRVGAGVTTTAIFTLAKGAWAIGWAVLNDLAIEK